MVTMYVFHVSVNSMTLEEVEELNSRLQQQIQGKESPSVLFVVCENVATKISPRIGHLLASTLFKFGNQDRPVEDSEANSKGKFR